MKRLVALIIIISSLAGVTKISAQVAVGVSVGIAPPALPVYEQPPCPDDGYLWCPGYWAWGPDGYYWVPGVWVPPPTIGFLWTPGYWGFVGGRYLWHAGYWGPHVGFYGGVCYGYGYGGHGFYGGRWVGGRFSYNTAAWHVGGGIHNTYVDRTVVVNNGNRASFNGPRGVTADPTPAERSAMNEHHVEATSAQRNNEHSASTNRNQLASVNKGRPATTAMSRVGGQRYNSAGHAVSHTAAHPANHAAPVNHAAPHPANVNHAAPHAANVNHARPTAPRPQSNMRANPNRGAVRHPQGGRIGGARGPGGGGGERGRK